MTFYIKIMLINQIKQISFRNMSSLIIIRLDNVLHSTLSKK